MRQFLNYLGWVLPYFIAGFAAPIIFRNFETNRAGHIAGSLFVFSGLWALYVARRHGFSKIVIWLFQGSLILNALFWSWRFLNSVPLAESELMGFSGMLWHRALTSLYLLVALLLILNLTVVRRSRR